MNDNEAKILITADSSGVQPGVAGAKGEIEGLAPLLQQLNEQFAGLSLQIKSAMTAGAASTDALKDEMKVLEAETERENLSLKEMVLQVHEGVESFNKFKLGLKEVAEAWMAAFAVERVMEWSKEIGEAAEKIQHLSQQFGMSTTQVQQLGGVAMATGVSIDALTRGMGIMDKALVNSKGSTSAQANAFKSLGISIDDGRSQMEKFMVVADKFKDMEDGPKKAALAMEAFGRSGKELIPILNLGSEGIEEINRKTEEYGVVNEAAQEAGMALAESWNENKLAMQGLSNILAEEYAPAMKSAVDAANDLIKSFIESYKEGGAAKQILDDIGVVAKVLAATLVEVAATFIAVAEAINALAAVIAGVLAPVLDGIIALTKMVAEAFITLGKVMFDALNLDWGAIESDFQAGMHQLAKDALDGGRAAGHDFVTGFKTAMEALSAANSAMAGADKFSRALFHPSEHKGVSEGKGSGEFDPELGATHKGKEKKGPSVAEQLEQELTAKKLAWAMEQDAQGTFEAFSLQSEADYWAQALKRTDLSAKDKLEIEKKYLAARLALHNQEVAFKLEAAKNVEAVGVEQAQAEIAAQRDALQMKLQLIDQEEKAHQISSITASKARADLNHQLSQLDQDLEERTYAIKMKGLQDELRLYDPKSVKYKQINDKIEQEEKQHLDRMSQMKRDAAKRDQANDEATLETQRNIYRQSFQFFSENVAKMMTGQQTFFQAVQNGWRGLQNVAARAIDNMVENWLVGLAMKESSAAAFHAKQVMHDAKQAAAGAWNAVVRIPVVGPVLAPIAAAAAFAGVMAFSAAGGDYNVKEGLYHLHEQEMVLPAHLAAPMRSMIENGGTAGAQGGGRPGTAGGDSHLHYAPTINGSTPKSLDKMLREEGDSMLRWFGGAMRTGQLKIA